MKVEATKYTEVGYVGRDVDSMVRELVEAAIRMIRREKTEQLRPKLDRAVQNKMVDILLPLRRKKDDEDLGGAPQRRGGGSGKRCDRGSCH